MSLTYLSIFCHGNINIGLQCTTDLHKRSGHFVHFVHKIRGYAHDRRRGHQPSHVDTPIRINIRTAGHHVLVAQYREYENQLHMEIQNLVLVTTLYYNTIKHRVLNSKILLIYYYNYVFI